MNHYDVLEVSPKASVEVIRAAYKSLMQRNHPDKHADAAAATARSTRIAQAYAVLSDAQRRATYDQSLHQPSYAFTPTSTPRRVHAGRVAPAPGRSWFVPLLILCTIAAGSAALVLLQKGKPSPGAMPLELRLDPRLSAKLAEPMAAAPAGPASRPPETAAELQARTVSSLVTNLSVELGPVDRTQPGSVHVLTIPNLGVRLAVDDPGRWARKIQAERPRIIQQLLANLATAQYIELIGAEGDLYLKRLIEDTVASAVGLDRYAPPPAAAASAGQPASAPPPRAVEALLPLSFAIR